ncbi:MAG: hypothetical protein RIR52_1912 [Acidobacteriota bacterium]|jgi:aminoglycoside/choline kinase family phosphotransferase
MASSTSDNKISISQSSRMQRGESLIETGGVSEKRVVRFMADYYGLPTSEVLVQPLTPDASTRKYFRVAVASDPLATLIVSLYPDPFNQGDNTYLDATRLFEKAGLPVPRIVNVSDTKGIILQEDLGDMSLSRWLEEAAERGDDLAVAGMLRQAIDLIVRIQGATTLAYAINAIASTLAFDESKLSWELDYFFTHYFKSYRRLMINDAETAAIRHDLEQIARELAARPRVLTHRDYHGMNLMVDLAGELRIIDHQDARMGPVTYDLVPILVERRLRPVDEGWVETQQEMFLGLRRQRGLATITMADLSYEFGLMTIQRQLKAIGTFSYQTAVVGRGEVYERYIRPSIETVLRAMKTAGTPAYPALEGALQY